MNAQVREARDVIAQPHHHELLVEQRDGERAPHGGIELIGPRHRVPAPPQRLVQPRLAGAIEVDVHRASIDPRRLPVQRAVIPSYEFGSRLQLGD